MTPRLARRLMVALWALTILVFLVDVAAIVVGRDSPYRGWGFRGYPALVGAMYATVGLIITRRRPHHLVGWLAALAGFLSAVQTGLFEYLLYATELYPDTLPGGPFVAWFLNWYWVPVVFAIILAVLLFPDGRLPAPRWRILVGLQIAVVLVQILARSVAPLTLDSSLPDMINPYGQPWAAGVLSELVLPGSIVFLVLAAGTALASLLARWLRGTAIERQQIKWLLYAMAVVVLTLPASAAGDQLLQSITQVALAMVPVAIGVAIVRYRLYDIDLIIRRTVVYLLITTLLAGTYFSVVVVLQQLLRAVSGQESPLAIVLSTLAIAALFAPLRRRVQTFVDRRFYRRKYDAAQALERFAATARDEVDLARLAAALVDTVNETVQPTQVTLWLKGGQ